MIVYSVLDLLEIREKIRPHEKRALLPDRSGSDKLQVALERLQRKLDELVNGGPRPVKITTSKIVSRYSFVLSNSAFKSKWIRDHGSLEGLKDQPRRDIRVFSTRVEFLEVYFKKVRYYNRKISVLKRKMGFKGIPKVSSETRGGYVPPQRRSKPAPRNPPVPVMVPPTALPKYMSNVGQLISLGEKKPQFIKVIGGSTLPAAGHSKYWYFKRKRGFFRVSEHHPYGDEEVVYSDPYVFPANQRESIPSKKDNVWDVPKKPLPGSSR